jgi:hypothetical protein
MARKIGVEHGLMYRAVLHNTQTGKRWIESPYDTPAAAKRRVTFWKNYFRDRTTGITPIEGHPEEGTTTWVRISDDE